MPTLMGLPNEILTSIIEATEPDDFESLSSCCKLMYSLARHRLEEHKKKKSLFSRVFVEDPNLPLSEPSQGERLNIQLQGFLSDERNRFYTKAMAVNLESYGVDIISGGGYHSTAKTSAVGDLEGFEKELEASIAGFHRTIGLEIEGIEAKQWGNQVKAGNPTASFLLLLALLPNLEKCSVENTSIFSPVESVASLSKIMRLMAEATLQQKENGPSFGGRLSKFTIKGWFGEGYEESPLPFFMVLPRMRKVQGHNVAMGNCSWPYADAVSPVVDLDMEGEIHDITLSNYIRGIRELKRFRCHYRDSCLHWGPCTIVAALKQFAFRSLVYLDLTTNEPFEHDLLYSLPGIGSLRSFEVLEAIRLQYVLLFEDVRTINSEKEIHSTKILRDLLDKSLIKGQNLIDFLPSSVRAFGLEHVARGEFFLNMFEGFQKHRVERLPKLRSITLDRGDGKIDSQVERICKESGVQLIRRRREVKDFWYRISVAGP